MAKIKKIKKELEEIISEEVEKLKKAEVRDSKDIVQLYNLLGKIRDEEVSKKTLILQLPQKRSEAYREIWGEVLREFKKLVDSETYKEVVKKIKVGWEAEIGEGGVSSEETEKIGEEVGGDIDTEEVKVDVIETEPGEEKAGEEEEEEKYEIDMKFYEGMGEAELGFGIKVKDVIERVVSQYDDNKRLHGWARDESAPTHVDESDYKRYKEYRKKWQEFVKTVQEGGDGIEILKEREKLSKRSLNRRSNIEKKLEKIRLMNEALQRKKEVENLINKDEDSNNSQNQTN